MSDIVQTQYGPVRGVRSQGITVWRGIPFAGPTAGAGRFLPPQPPRPWTEVLDATQFGPAGWQVKARDILKFGSVPDLQQSEDCLTLNVWSPKADGRRRPVLVWVYGGSFVMGGGRLPVYSGASFAGLGDIVVVTFNYRPGPFGFLYLGDIGGNAYSTSGNVGLLDQIAALQWVRQNIDAFGGDPDRVTIAGESAGAISVSALLTMPDASGLFHRAIMQSGVGLLPPIGVDARVRTRQIFLDRLGIHDDVLEQLRSRPAEELHQQSVGLPWVPMLDSASVAKPFWSALAAGALPRIPMLVGCNHHEFRYFMESEWQALDPPVMQARFNQTLAGPVDSRVVDAYCGQAKGRDLYFGLARIGTDKLFTAPTHIFAGIQSPRSPVWAYRFDWKSRVEDLELGACHALEVPFVFNTLHAPGVHDFTGYSSDQPSVAGQMHRAWIRFVRDGNPQIADMPPWPAYSLQKRETMLISGESLLAFDPDRFAREYWEPFFMSSAG